MGNVLCRRHVMLEAGQGFEEEVDMCNATILKSVLVTVMATMVVIGGRGFVPTAMAQSPLCTGTCIRGCSCQRLTQALADLQACQQARGKCEGELAALKSAGECTGKLKECEGAATAAKAKVEELEKELTTAKAEKAKVESELTAAKADKAKAEVALGAELAPKPWEVYAGMLLGVTGDFKDAHTTPTFGRFGTRYVFMVDKVPQPYVGVGADVGTITSGRFGYGFLAEAGLRVAPVRWFFLDFAARFKYLVAYHRSEGQGPTFEGGGGIGFYPARWATIVAQVVYDRYQPPDNWNIVAMLVSVAARF